ncbi:hypothetical protein BLA29_001959 [Euroglyphus maynei]|uniref:RRM domain-containing protein n=1 Tax=Euroglyphus maynei TaxID=6958 RepID=A0A1Y3BGT3_EURMA|nr:hypothetical protein BLA29_001959 [Euroglyphus maynei]
MQRLIGMDGKKWNNIDNDDRGICPVPLKAFLSFNKIRELTHSLNVLLKAFDKDCYSDLDSFLIKHDLHYDPKTQSLRRIKPYNVSMGNLTNRTVYLEGFESSNAQVDFLVGIMEQLGPILSLRVHKRPYPIGFAFIEFQQEEHAQILCNWFNNNNNDKSLVETEYAEMVDKLVKIENDLKNIKHKDYQIRVLSKSEWNHYKNRYLRTRRRCRAKSLKNENEIRQRFELKSDLYPPCETDS